MKSGDRYPCRSCSARLIYSGIGRPRKECEACRGVFRAAAVEPDPEWVARLRANLRVSA